MFYIIYMKNHFSQLTNIIGIILMVFGAFLLYQKFSANSLSSTQEQEKTILENDTVPEEYQKTAVFAAGCFWCVESGFEHYEEDGIIDAISGYAGGSAEEAEYQKVASGKTQHREVVQVLYDSRRIAYDDLLEIFWRQFDPTDDGGSFVDRGPQYTSGIFYQTETERILAEQSKQELADSGKFTDAIVTPIIELQAFYPAEEYHQDYYQKDPEGYYRYRNGSGRDQFIEQVWGEEKYYSVPKRYFSEEELRIILTPEQYHITQEDGTETPFQNEYWDNTKPGIYVDIITGEALFSSVHKYKSGTGWPSFTEPISETALQTQLDYKLVYPRTEVRSRLGDNHIGHVFEDGPEEAGGLRYCMNSAALEFIPVESMEEEGYGEYISMFNN